jgi:hypothetical protein
MPSLHELQRAMRRILLAPLPDGNGGVPAGIVAAGLDPALRLDIYRNTMRATCINALRLGYPAVRRLVGDEFFEGSAGLFVQAHPPQCADLNAYGAAFADFLQDFAPAASIAYLGDVARLEWAVNRALHAPDAPPLDVARLNALAPTEHARIRFTPHPSITLLRSAHPVDAIWRAVLQQDEDAMAAIDLASGPACLLVQRHAGTVEVLRLPALEWQFAERLFGGHTLGQAQKALLATMPRAPVAAWIAQHLTQERFVAFALQRRNAP